MEVLASHNISVDLLHTENIANTLAWQSFVVEYVDVIKRHQTSANQLFGFLDGRARVQPEIMADAYTSILNEIVRRSGDVFTHPVKLSRVRKALLGLRLSLRKVRARLFA